MAYSKMTVDGFKKRLKDGTYDTATGARRAIGKADMSDGDKDKGRAAINKYFGEDVKKPPAKKTEPFKAGTKKKSLPSKKKAAKKKGAAKKAAPAKAAEPTKAPARKVNKASKKRTGTKKKDAAAIAAEELAVEGIGEMSEQDRAALATLHIHGEVIGTIMQVTNMMTAAKAAHPELDCSPLAAAGPIVESIFTSIQTDVLGGQLNLPGVETSVDPKVAELLAKTAPASLGLPGQASPVQVPTNQVAAAPVPPVAPLETVG